MNFETQLGVLVDRIEKLTASVTEHRIKLAEEIATLATKVDHVSADQKLVANEVRTISANELQCLARIGFPELRNRLDEIESEVQFFKGDATGRINLLENKKRSVPPAQKETNNLSQFLSWQFLRVAIPWLFAAAISAGVWFASGGDKEAVAQVLDKLNTTTHQIDMRLKKIEELKVPE
jgi:uncharacterized coiled-coil DUF342 family protein